MHTAHLETVCISVSVASTRCHSWGFPNEQVWTGLQWSLPDFTSRGSQVWCPVTFPEKGTLPCDLSHNAFDVTPHSEQTNTCENITGQILCPFPYFLFKLELTSVKMFWLIESMNCGKIMHELFCACDHKFSHWDPEIAAFIGSFKLSIEKVGSLWGALWLTV